MDICPCFGRKKSRGSSIIIMNHEPDNTDNSDEAQATSHLHHSSSPVKLTAPTLEPRLKCATSLDSSRARNSYPTFSYRELAAATKNFRNECLIGEGGFGSVYKGKIENTGQVVAVKKLDPSGFQGSKEFLVEVLMLSLLHHPNLVSLVGFCSEGEQRLLVYEFLPLGSLEYHLHDLPPDAQPLDWNTRMKIAAGIAEGLDYLHNKAVPPVIHRDLKSSNILLDEWFHPKLSDFGLAKFGPSGEKSHVSTRIMGTEGYCAPEYYDTGKLTTKSDIYCYGILLLEIISGRRAKDATREHGGRSLLEWARPWLKEPSKFVEIADERLNGKFSDSGLHHAIEVALRCLQEVPQSRPSMTDVLSAMKFLTRQQKKERMHMGAQGSKDDEVRRGHGEKGKHEKMRVMDDRKRAEVDGSREGKTKAKSSSQNEERKLAVAEAKLWGESWRAKMQLDGDREFDKSNL